MPEPAFSKNFFNRYRSDGDWKERFMNVHPGVEAYLRHIIFVGLRMQRVNYHDAQKCVYENRVVDDFPSHFQTLFGQEWKAFLAGSPRLDALWDLFANQAKPVRNRVFHGLRDYDPEMYALCYRIDVELIEALSKALLARFGHDFLPPLKDLNLPRVGKTGIPPDKVLKKLRAGKAPRFSGTGPGLEHLRAELNRITKAQEKA